MRKNYTFQEFIRIGRELFVEIAEQEIEQHEAKVNTSRISAMTGINRNEVSKIRRSELQPKAPTESLASRVISTWELDKRFLTSSGKTKVLTFKGEDSQFYALVRLVSKHVNPGAILFDLERSGAVRRTARGIKLQTRTFSVAQDPRRGFDLLSRDMSSLIEAVVENILEDKPISNLHLYTVYDNLPDEEIEGLREWLIQQGKDFHSKIRKRLASFELSQGTIRESRSGRVVVGTYSLAQPYLSEKLELVEGS